MGQQTLWEVGLLGGPSLKGAELATGLGEAGLYWRVSVCQVSFRDSGLRTFGDGKNCLSGVLTIV